MRSFPVHHSPSGPPVSARLTAALSRWAYHLRRSLRLRGPVVPVVLVCGVVAGIVLAIPALRPMVTGATPETPAALAPSAAASSGSSSSETSPSMSSSAGPGTSRGERSGVVQWGVDGAAPAPSTTESAPGSTAQTPAPVPDTSAASSPPAPPAAPSPAASSPAPAATGGTTASSSAPAPSPTSAPPPAPTGGPAPADPDAEGQVLALVNQERAAAGCGALVADDGLAAVARAFSADMRDRGFFSHTDPDGLTPSERGDRAGVTVLAENIAFGQPDPAAVMTDWMNSAGHRANILNCSYSRIGVGVAHGAGGPWWTQDFA